MNTACATDRLLYSWMLNQVQHDDVGVVLTEDLSVPVMPDLIRHPESSSAAPVALDPGSSPICANFRIPERLIF